AGTYKGTLQISAPGANPSSQTVAVNLTIAAPAQPSSPSTPPTSTPSAPSSGSSAAIPTNGLVGYWTFDQANISSRQVRDSSNSGLTGAELGGLASTTGVVNQALQFDGQNSSVQFPADTATDLSGSVSLSLWVKTSNASRTEALISRYSAAGMETGYL